MLLNGPSLEPSIGLCGLSFKVPTGLFVSAGIVSFDYGTPLLLTWAARVVLFQGPSVDPNSGF